MSFWSTVYVGDAGLIGHALRGKPRAGRGPLVLGSADLPSVLPTHCEALMQVVGDPSLTFASQIEEHLAGDTDPEATSGAYRMAPSWASLFAGLSDAMLPQLVRQWMDKLGGSYASASEEAAQRVVRQLVELCRTAQQRGADVVYFWTM